MPPSPPSPITDLARERAIRRHPAAHLCRWSAAVEQITLTNLRIGYAWHRTWLRLLFGALLVVAATGCASDAAVIRITEYRAGTLAATVAGQGVAVTQSGKEAAFARVEILYRGDRGTVAVSSDPSRPDPAAASPQAIEQPVTLAPATHVPR